MLVIEQHWPQFNIDVTTCDQCGVKVKVIACIEAPKAIEKKQRTVLHLRITMTYLIK
jgi:hypothetical protein